VDTVGNVDILLIT